MPKPLKLTPKFVSDIVADYNSGMSGQPLADKYGVAKATISKALRKAGIIPRRNDGLFSNKDLPEETVSAIIEDFKAGMTVIALAEKYDCYKLLIDKLLLDRGLKTKKPYRYRLEVRRKHYVRRSDTKVMTYLSDQEQEELCRQYVEEVLTKQDLAAKFNVHIDTVSNILKKHGIATKHFVSADTIEAFCDMWKEGNVTIYDIANIYKIAPATVKFWLVKRGLDFITPPKAKGVKAGELRKLAREAGGEPGIRVLEDIMNDPTLEARDRMMAVKMLQERGFGKPREEDEEPEEKTSLSATILKMVPKGSKIVNGENE